jgi:lysophospholipase L1-like esterase
MIRRATPILLIALLALTMAAAGLSWRGQQPRAYTPQGAGELYVALGDSLAWGFRLDDRAAQSYPALLFASLAPTGPRELANLAVPGETSDSLLERQLPQAVALIRDARRRGITVSPITLNIGGNDLLRVERASPAERAAAIEAARRNLGRALDELRAAAGPRADLAVMTYYNPYGGDPLVVDGDAYWVERLNEAIRAESARRGVAVAEAHAAFAGGREYTHTFVLLGDIHANAQGHRLLAAVFAQALGYSPAPTGTLVAPTSS